MLRVPGLSRAAAPALACAAVLGLAACDLFSTREFRPKPSDIRVLPGLAKPGDTISFRATESVWRADADAPEATLSRRRLTFAFLRDSLIGADTLKLLALTVREESTGTVIEQGSRFVRFGSEGVSLSGGETGGSARMFPLKAAAGSAAADTGFPALPSMLVEGWDETVALGILTVMRAQTSVDTLEYRGRSEEAWAISETVVDGGRTVASGRFWYGASGLLKARQEWQGFGWRSANGAPPAGAGVTVNLRRDLVRL